MVDPQLPTTPTVCPARIPKPHPLPRSPRPAAVPLDATNPSETRAAPHLRAGDDHRLAEVLQHVGERRGGVGHRVRAVEDHEAVEPVVPLLQHTHRVQMIIVASGTRQ